MDVQNPSAPPRAQSRTAGKNHPHRRRLAGVIHDNTRHTTRLTALLPPPPPVRAPAPALDVRHPLQTCEGCDRAFRSPAPGRCRGCRTPSPASS